MTTDWSDGWPSLPSQRNWDEIYWGQGSPDRGLTQVTASSTLSTMARAEVIEWTDDFLGGDSTSIEHVWYNENTQRMTVRFTPKATGPGGIYSYDNVSPSLFREFRESDSLGHFFRNTFRRPAPATPWPGARHEDGRTTFKRIPVEPGVREVDLDALKAAKLTTGKGQEYLVHFAYSASGEMPVRAESPEAAVAIFEQWMTEHGYTAEATHVTMTVKRKG